MIISVANSRKEKLWKNIEITWEEFLERVSKPFKTAETIAEYHKLSKSKQDDLKDVGGFVGGKLKDGLRKNGYVEHRSMLTLDMDYAEQDFWDKYTLLFDYTCCIYSTRKHTSKKPRLRLLLPLSRTITAEEYGAVSRKVAEEIGIEQFDDTTHESARLMYWPSVSANGEFVFKSQSGTLLNPDDYLKKYSDWINTAEWPVSSRQTETVKRSLEKQSDPLLKDGIIGSFCKAYSIQDAIDVFLSDIYKPSVMDGRYDYIPADSTAGVVIYDDKFAFSHHASDPVSGKLCNAFDLVRLHRFGDRDSAVKEGASVSKLPSYIAMQELAINDENVKKQVLSEKQEQASKDFSDWKTALVLDKAGNVKNTLQNLILILENDENLKGIVFNQLLDGMEIRGKVPWKTPSKFWRDADDAQLIKYIEFSYGGFTKRNYDIAVTAVTDDRSYHPIREYIKSLPEWDSRMRVETLLIEYLGADDNEYVRAVTRKTLCAAIARVLNPGCKFDSMLVLNGPQGIGKSTLISKLAGEWFSDSLNLGDTKDKTAAEKLQGYWILEIGELAGLKKAEIETLRSFLSRQNDIYRASFGKRATPHLRQCIFFGTTNAEKGYLRDTTGNRRFWPVKTPGSANKNAWQLSQSDIDQIWAETLVYVKKGEPLYLDKDLDTLAKSEQREAMEGDEREGLVHEYLETLLPEGWLSMDLHERRDFLNGNDFGAAGKVGTEKRGSVSNIEIWCECFGKDRSSLNKMESNNISAIMSRISTWEKSEKKERLPLYGPQWIYVPKDK